MKKINKWGPVVAWMALIFILSAQPRLPSPEERWLDFIFEKSAHAFEFAVLAILFLRALDTDHSSIQRTVLIVVILVWFYALSDEFHQSFVPGRSVDWSDIFFDWLGSLVGIWFWLRRRRIAEGHKSARIF